MKPQHKIGEQFIRRSSKRKDVETIIDILTTTDSKGDVVKIRYVALHNFCGQPVIDNDVLQSTITMGKITN
jgi:hypothetical protein